jgi:hypothetical protein
MGWKTLDSDPVEKMLLFFTVKGTYYWKKTQSIANIFLHKIERYTVKP